MSVMRSTKPMSPERKHLTQSPYSGHKWVFKPVSEFVSFQITSSRATAAKLTFGIRSKATQLYSDPANGDLNFPATSFDETIISLLLRIDVPV